MVGRFASLFLQIFHVSPPDYLVDESSAFNPLDHGIDWERGAAEGLGTCFSPLNTEKTKKNVRFERLNERRERGTQYRDDPHPHK